MQDYVELFSFLSKNISARINKFFRTLFIYLSPTVRQGDILHLACGFEQRCNLFVGEAGNTASDTGDTEKQFGMLLGVPDDCLLIWTIR